jgi:F-type H+-transporting ATPase subunit alpha
MSDDVERLADGWLDGARARLDRAELGAKVESIGRVEEVEDGVALVSGLPDVGLDELVRFDGGQFGFAQTLERDRVGCVLLDEAEAVEAGDAVRGTGDVVRVPVGEALLGRIVDPLGRPIDGGGPIAASRREPIERAAPGILERELVTEPVQTGVLVFDALFALGRGQRELIIGDRAIGKTTLAVDAIIAQSASTSRSGRRRRACGARSTRSRRTAIPRAASSSSPRRRARPDCNGSPLSPASRWPSISATAAATH